MKVFRSVISDAQRSIVLKLAPLLRKNHFYLGGGTAIAVQLEHRTSVDLDWFCEQRMGNPRRLVSEFKNSFPSFRQTKTSKGTIHGEIEGVRVSFLEFAYPMLNPLVIWKDGNYSMASLEDLACMKLSAIVGRGARKDFIDIYAILKEGFTLNGLLDSYKRKFSVDDVTPVLDALQFFGDAEAEPMPQMIWDVKWKNIKGTILKTFKEVSKSRL